MKYKVLIEEIYSKVVIVEADSYAKAREMTEEAYERGEIDMNREVDCVCEFTSYGKTDEEDLEFYDEVGGEE